MDSNDWKKSLDGIFKIAKFAKDVDFMPKYIFYTPIFSGFYVFISDKIILAKNKDLSKNLFQSDLDSGKINHFERISLNSFLLTAENIILKVTISENSFIIRKVNVPNAMFSFSYKNDSILVILSNCSTKIIQCDETVKDMWTLNENQTPNSAIFFNENLFVFSTESKLFVGKIESDTPVVHTFHQINKLFKSTKDSLFVLNAEETGINYVSFDENFEIVRNDKIIKSSGKITGTNIIYDDDQNNEEVFFNTIQKENEWKREMEGASYSIIYCEKNVVYAYSPSNEQPMAMATIPMDSISVTVPLKARHFISFSENGKSVICRLTDEFDVSQRLQFCVMQNILGDSPKIGCFSHQENSFVIITDSGKVVIFQQSIQWFHISYYNPELI